MPNRGLAYEAEIRDDLHTRGLMPLHLFGVCTQYGNDAAFVFGGQDYFLEVKNKTAPDYGARKIVYDKPSGGIWKWNDPDNITALLDAHSVLSNIPVFEPRKYVKSDLALDKADRDFDRRQFAKTIDLGTAGAYLIHRYYADKRCSYIQVENKGFYHLLDNPAGLGVPQFTPSVSIRLRAKTHSSEPIHNYSFRAVIVGSMKSIIPSTYDICDTDKTCPI